MRYSILALFLFFVPLESGRAATEPTPDLIRVLARQGAPELALAAMDGVQGSVDGQDRRAAWELLRWELLAELGRWPELLQRTQDIPPGIFDGARDQVLWRSAQAAAGLRHGDEARDLLARLLWQGEADPERTREARRLVVDGLFGSGNPEDAYRAALRFLQDYHPLRREEIQSFAKGFLAHDRRADALALIGPETEGAVALYLRLLAGAVTPAEAAERARAGLEKNGQDNTGYWAVLAEVFRLGEDVAARTAALEGLVEDWRDDSPDLFRPQPDALWQAYLTNGALVGNQHQVLQGEDDAWLALASRLEQQDPLASRALLGYLARQTPNAALRRQAENRLALALLRAGLARVAHAIFAPRDDLVPILMDILGDPSLSAERSWTWFELGSLARMRGDFLRAAECELLSLSGGDDDEARRARALIADSLARAGLRADARRQYRTLLDSELEPGRRRFLRQMQDATQP